MKIVICGNYGAQNEGDEMILTGLLKSVKSTVPKAQITVLSADPTQTQKRHTIPTVKPFPTGIRSILNYIKQGTKTAKVVKECDIFMLGGGGLFAGPSFRANLIWATQAKMAYFYKKNVIMYGQSVGKSKNKIVNRIIKNIFNKASLITVRDQESKINLQNIGVTNEIHVMPDLAFRYSEKINPTKNKKVKVTVALREMSGLKKQFFNEINGFLKWLKDEKNAEISYVNFQEGELSDSHIHKKLKSKPKKNKIEDIKKADYIIGMRLHSIITAIKNEKPFVAINYFSKVKNLLNDVGLSNSLINLDEVTTTKLKTNFLKIEKDKLELKTKMAIYNKMAQEQLINFEKSILTKVLNKG